MKLADQVEPQVSAGLLLDGSSGRGLPDVIVDPKRCWEVFQGTSGVVDAHDPQPNLFNVPASASTNDWDLDLTSGGKKSGVGACSRISPDVRISVRILCRDLEGRNGKILTPYHRYVRGGMGGIGVPRYDGGRRDNCSHLLIEIGHAVFGVGVRPVGIR